MLGAATALALLRWRARRAPEDRRRALTLAVVLPLAAAACLATPLGTGIFDFLGDSMVRIRAVGIGEWQRTLPNDAYGAIFWVAALAFVALVIVRRGALRAGGHASSWADWVIVAAPLALLPLAAAAVRNVGLFALLAVPAASRLLGPEVRIPLPWRTGGRVARRRRSADREPGPARAARPLAALGVRRLELPATRRRSAGGRSTSARWRRCARATGRSTTSTTRAAT